VRLREGEALVPNIMIWKGCRRRADEGARQRRLRARERRKISLGHCCLIR
jgi:hypothetical protein